MFRIVTVQVFLAIATAFLVVVFIERLVIDLIS
jgi:hypothetical protein